MKANIFFSIFLVLTVYGNLKVYSQNPDIVWSKSYGGSDDDWAYSIQQTTDQGYIVAGITFSNDGDVSGNHGEADVWVLKLNSDGDTIWKKIYGGYNNDVLTSIKQTSDKGYVFVGYTDSNNGDVSGNHGESDAWVVKIDSTGMIQWQNAMAVA